MKINIHSTVRRLVFGLTAALVAALVACGGNTSNTQGPAPLALSGSVHGGQQPVSGAQVTAYVAGNGNFGSSAAALACVATNANGAYSFGGSGAISCGGSLPTSFSCPSANCPLASSSIYLIASGGNPGLAAGTNNTGLVLMAALGPANQTSASTTVNITELTTAAGVYALAQMMGASSSGCVDCTGSLASRLQNDLDIGAKSPQLENAFARANSLVSFTTSAPGVALPAAGTCTGAGGTGSDPVNCGAEEKLNTLADAMASCVNTTGPTSSACALLFCAATPGATFNIITAACTPPSSGVIPVDTLQSALSIALAPGLIATSGLENLVGNQSPFAPALNAPPNDWTLALNFTGSGLAVAIDASGNVWLTNPSNNSVAELRNSGAPAAGSPFTGGGLSGPDGIAIDASGNVWVTNFLEATIGNGSVTELSSSGTPVTGSPFTGGGLSAPEGVAIDASGNVWVTDPLSLGTVNAGLGSVTELTSSGAVVPGSPFIGGGQEVPTGIAIDASDNVWVSNTAGNSVTELTGSGAVVAGSPFTGGGLNSPGHIAIDGGGNAWVANNVSPGSMTELTSSGTVVSGSPFTGGGLDSPEGIAIDGGGNVWVTNNANGSVTELSGKGAALSPSTGFTGGGLDEPLGIAIDASGDVWLTNTDNEGSVTELIGAAVPKKTPFIGPPQTP